MKKLELKIPPLIVTLIFGLLIWLLPSPVIIQNSYFITIISFLISAIGTIVALLGVIQFKRNETTVNPMVPDESDILVTEGIYRFTRNPMYLGFLLWLISWAFFLKNPISLLPILAFIFYINRFQIIPEEKILLENFGAKFQLYMKNTKRWI